jgi:hypothetical protein
MLWSCIICSRVRSYIGFACYDILLYVPLPILSLVKSLSYIYIHRVLSPIDIVLKWMCVAKLAWSGFSAIRPASVTNIDFWYVLFYAAALPRWRRGLQYPQRYSWHFFRVLSCVYPIILFVYPIVSCIRFSVFYRGLRLSGFPSIVKFVYRVTSESLGIVNNI